METTPPRKPIARLLLPQTSLANCLFGTFVRDTRGCNLAINDRFNFFASSPLCGISWFFEGTFHHLQNSNQMDCPSKAPVLPKLCFSGPYEQPQTSWNKGEVNAMVAAFYPDAFSALTGINIADYLNRSVPIEDVLTGELLQLVKDVFRTGDTKPGFQLLERELAPLWQQARPHAPVYGNQVADWARSLGVRAAMSGVGRSTRQIERRFKSWTGHSRRTLNLFAKGEQTFKKARIARAENRFDPAGLAAELGYADQSHMGRQVKDITGFSPAEFMRRYESEEAFWSFRVMGERF